MPKQIFPNADADADAEVDWNAVWIRHEADHRRINSYFHFRKAFDVEFEPDASTLHITADTQYMV